MENSMTIEFIVTIEDFVAFNLFHSKNSPTLQRQLLITRSTLAFVVAAILFLPCPVLVGELSYVAFLFPIVGIIVGIIFFLAYPRMHEQNLRKQLPKMLNEGTNESVIGKQTIIITPEAVINETPTGEQKAFWSSVDKIVETSDYIFLYVSSVSAAIIPRSAFPSEEQRNAFLELAKQYHQSATGRRSSTISS
jgi:hypothetical protein